MNPNLVKILVVLLPVLMGGMSAVGQVDITLSGSWNYNIASSALLEAGNDFSTTTYQSATNQVLLNITNSPKPNRNFVWRIDVRKSDISWNANLILSARRTGNSIPLSGGSITGGLAFQAITNSNQTFFSGRKSVSDIPIQYQITGASVLIPAQTFSTTIIYTVTEL
jgi:hypothetical protein